MEYLMLKELILICCSISCVAVGFFVGYILIKQRNETKIKRFKFIKIEKGIIRLNTTTGELLLINNSQENQKIHKGKKYPGVIGAFDIEIVEGGIVLFDSYTGYSKFLN